MELKQIVEFKFKMSKSLDITNDKKLIKAIKSVQKTKSPKMIKLKGFGFIEVLWNEKIKNAEVVFYFPTASYEVVENGNRKKY